MKKVYAVLALIVIFVSACAAPATPTLTPTEVPPPTETPLPTSTATLVPTETTIPTITPTPRPKTNKILLIFGQHFIPSIYTTVTPMLEEAGYEVIVASSNRTDLKAKDDPLEVKVDTILKSVKVEEYDAIIFLCDNDLATGSAKSDTNRIAREAVENGILVGAICAAPRILAWADVVDGKTVTGEPSATCALLDAKGGDCTGASVEVDGLMITARTRGSSTAFGNAILEVLAGEG